MPLIRQISTLMDEVVYKDPTPKTWTPEWKSRYVYMPGNAYIMWQKKEGMPNIDLTKTLYSIEH